MPLDVYVPPHKYDHKPAMVVIEHVAPIVDVEKFCRSRSGHRQNGFYRITGCQWFEGKTCHIVVPSDLYTKQTRRHELAHCNGWPADHPDATREELK
jgi:hypothetical protein